MKLPSVFDYDGAVDFFAGLIEANSENQGFSQRLLAKRLRWPASYIPDLLAGRKPLTVTRAYEFARSFKLDTLATERLILLAVKSQNPEVEASLGTVLCKGLEGRFKKTVDPVILDYAFNLVFEAIRWLRDKATEENLNRLLALQEITSAQISISLQKLEAQGFIERRNEMYYPLIQSFHTDDLNSHIDNSLHIEMAKGVIHYFEKNKIGPASYNSGVVHLGMDSLNEVVNRILALRNWILELSTEESKKVTHSSRLFQMELHLLPLFDKSHMDTHGFLPAAAHSFPKACSQGESAN